MATKLIPFLPNQASGQSELGGASPEAVNVIIDEGGVVRRRPGMQASSLAPEGAVFGEQVTGLHRTEGGELYAVVGNNPLRDVYLVQSSAAVNLSTGAKLRGGLRPTFAETQAILAIAAGSVPLKVVFPGIPGAVTELGGSPPKATHVIANAARLLLNDSEYNQRIHYSGLAAGSSFAGHEDWDDLGEAGFFEGESRPDRVLAMHENTNEVFLFGSTTLQVWNPDSTARYAPGATRELGCSAAYSVIKKDQSFAWLDHLRRFVVSDGRSFEVLSGPIQKDLKELGTVSDCFGFWCHEGPVNVFVWVFPTDGRAWAYQLGGGWSEWLGWSGSNWAPLNVSAHLLVSGLGLNLVGTKDGKIGELTRLASTDYGDLINARVTTGFLNRGTNAVKRCRQVRLLLRRGAGKASSSASQNEMAWLCWRDRPGEWEARVPIDLGDSVDRDIVVPLRALGTYRSRQWMFEFSANHDLEFVGAEEDYFTTGVN